MNNDPQASTAALSTCKGLSELYNALRVLFTTNKQYELLCLIPEDFSPNPCVFGGEVKPTAGNNSSIFIDSDSWPIVGWHFLCGTISSCYTPYSSSIVFGFVFWRQCGSIPNVHSDVGIKKVFLSWKEFELYRIHSIILPCFSGVVQWSRPEGRRIL